MRTGTFFFTVVDFFGATAFLVAITFLGVVTFFVADALGVGFADAANDGLAARH